MDDCDHKLLLYFFYHFLYILLQHSFQSLYVVAIGLWLSLPNVHRSKIQFDPTILKKSYTNVMYVLDNFPLNWESLSVYDLYLCSKLIDDVFEHKVYNIFRGYKINSFLWFVVGNEPILFWFPILQMRCELLKETSLLMTTFTCC